jgi:hypothetical protein
MAEMARKPKKVAVKLIPETKNLRDFLLGFLNVTELKINRIK